MINSTPPQSSTLAPKRSASTPSSAPVRRRGRVAGIATAIVIALWFAFYLLVFLPRSV